MTAHLQRSLSTLLALLLTLTTLTAPGATAAPAPSGPPQPEGETMPEGLMRALLEASSQPFVARADGYYARSRGLDFGLHASGLQANADGLAWGLALTGFGRAQQMASLPEVEIVQTLGLLEYCRGALIEWYRDTAVGVEQGFTIHQAPPGAGALTLQLDVSTDLACTADADGRGLSFATPDGQVLRYDHLTVWDASGAQLDANLAYSPGQVMLRVEDSGAVYPVTVDPVIYLEQKVFIAPAGPYEHFGVSVALYGDTALVGASLENVGANLHQGAAYVFTRSGTTWSPQQQLTAWNGEEGDRFGSSVALSDDTALVGAPFHDIGGIADRGSVYVFTRTGATWNLQQELMGSYGTPGADSFGYSVALSGDTALVGACGDDVNAKTDQGSAHVFRYGGGVWSEQVQLTAEGGAAYDWFGTSVVLDDDGDQALVGAPGDDAAAIDQGSVYVFTFIVDWHGNRWFETQQLTASDAAANDWFGHSLALSGDTALVGANGDDVGTNTDQGSAYVFTLTWGSWSEQAHLIASGGAVNDGFGGSVAVSGNTGLVGAPDHDVGTYSQQGAAYVFTGSGATWSQQQELTTPKGAEDDSFGDAVALSGDTALVGVPYDDVGTNADQGSVYVFTRSGTTWIQQARITSSDGAGGDHFGKSVALSGDTALVGASADDVGTNSNQGSAYVFTCTGGIWSERKKLTAGGGEAGDAFGWAVALSGDTALVGAPGSGPAMRGSAYVFTGSGASWTEQAQLVASDPGLEDQFGYAVALSGDSNTALVGACLDIVGSNIQQGSAYVFTRTETNWDEKDQLLAPDGEEYDHFGISVALDDDGNQALVGTPEDDVGATDQGSAYVFTRVDEYTWTQEQKLTASDSAKDDYFGCAVALSGDMAVVGAVGDDGVFYPDLGSAYLFTCNGTTWSEQKKLWASDQAAGDRFGLSVALWGNTALVGVPDDDIDANTDQGSAYFYSWWFTTYLPLVFKNAS